MKITSKKKEILLLALILLLQSAIFVIAGANKSYIHMDEAYSFGLTTYDKVEIQDNEDFYDTWHDGSYYMDYLVLDEDEAGDYSPVYENQRDDVHPPLYYLMLRVAMGFSVGTYSVWPGIIVNMVIYLFVTAVVYLILRKLLSGHTYHKEKALALTFLCSVSLASISAVVYLRMYALSALWVLLTAYLHIHLAEKHFSMKLMFPIALVALAGSLTHYYFLFFLAATYLTVTAGYLRKKEWRYAAVYTAAMLVAAAASLAIFPYSIEHMFFGYRGEGAQENMANPAMYLANIGMYLNEASNSMNHLLYPLLALLVIGVSIFAYKRFYQNDKSPAPVCLTGKAAVLRMVWIPTAFYFLLVAIASPWCALRYIMPVCPLIFILVVYGAVWITRRITDEHMEGRMLAAVMALMVLAPVLTFSKPQELFLQNREIVEMVEGDYDLPAVYFYDTDEDRFLDDILLFAKLEQSYVAKDVISHNKLQDKGTVREIFAGKDTSDGVLLFINGEQLHYVIIDTVRETLGLQMCKKLAHMNACDVYYIS